MRRQVEPWRSSEDSPGRPASAGVCVHGRSGGRHAHMHLFVGAEHRFPILNAVYIDVHASLDRPQLAAPCCVFFGLNHRHGAGEQLRGVLRRGGGGRGGCVPPRDGRANKVQPYSGRRSVPNHAIAVDTPPPNHSTTVATPPPNHATAVGTPPPMLLQWIVDAGLRCGRKAAACGNDSGRALCA
eukprot:gene17088-biopygen12849